MVPFTLTVAAALACTSAQSAAPVIYVAAEATGGNDGSSWENAFTNLHDALAAAEAIGGTGVQLWVAAGVYSPGEMSYTLVSGTALFGGFAG